MAIINGTNLAAGIVPFTTEDTYPTHYAAYGKGGHRTVQSLVNRDSIPSSLKEEGMTVFVIDNNTRYIWKKNPNNGNVVEWLEDNSGGGSVAAGSNTQVMFNDNGTLSGSSDFTYDKTTGHLTTTGFKTDNNYLVSLGKDACRQVAGQCIFIGGRAGKMVTNGFSSTVIGDNAAGNVTDIKSRNTYIGTGTGYNNSGDNNLFIGTSTGWVETTKSNTLLIESNKVRNDNKDYLIEGDFSQRWVRFNGALRKRVVNITASNTVITSGTITSSTSQSIVDIGNTFTDSISLRGLIITSGISKGECKIITGYSTNTLSFNNPFKNIPPTGSTYKVVEITSRIFSEKLNTIYNITLDSEDGVLWIPENESNYIGSSLYYTIVGNPNNKTLYIVNASVPGTDKIILPHNTFSISTSSLYQENRLSYSGKITHSVKDIPTLQPIKTSTKDLVIDLYSKIYKIDVATATTVTFNIDSSYTPILTGNSLTIELDVNMTVASAITWPVNVTWIGGSAPTFGSVAKYRLVFRTEDAGTTWLGNLAYTY